MYRSKINHMNVFLSWSGDKSSHSAKVLKTWLSHFFPSIEFRLSKNDNNMGSKWYLSLNASLENTKVGILCLTKENIKSPWILFESGAMAHALGEKHIIPLLIDVENKDLPGPLSYFQSLTTNRNDMYALVKILSKYSSLKFKGEKHLETLFENWHPLLEDQIREINKTKTDLKNKDSVKILTAKELSFLHLLVEGKNKYEIVSATRTSMGTYHSNIKSLCTKLEAKSKAELIELVKYYELV